MSYSVTIPIDQADIEKEIKRAGEEINRLNNELKKVVAALESIQNCCTHPETESGNDWGRWSYTRCLVCNKEW